MAAYPKIKISYFNIEGAAEKVRLALIAQGIPFEDHRIGMPEWEVLKPIAKFGQVPLMYINDGAPVGQSYAMLRYVARLGDGSLYPQDPLKLLAIEEAIGLVDDLARAFQPSFFISTRPSHLGYPEKYNETPEGQEAIKRLRTNFVTSLLPMYLGYFTKMLAESGGPYICGSTFTIADCTLLPALRNFRRGHLDHIPVDCMDGYPDIIAYIDRVMSIPAISAWYATKK